MGALDQTSETHGTSASIPKFSANVACFVPDAFATRGSSAVPSRVRREEILDECDVMRKHFCPCPQAACSFYVGEKVFVLADDGKTWMDAVVGQFFPDACFAEGYYIPSGTVKVATQLGTKWILKDKVSTTLQREAFTLLRCLQDDETTPEWPRPEATVTETSSDSDSSCSDPCLASFISLPFFTGSLLKNCCHARRPEVVHIKVVQQWDNVDAL